MKIPRYGKIIILCIISTVIIACGLFQGSDEDELSDLQNTIEVLSDKLEEQEQESQPTADETASVPTSTGVVRPTLQATESSSGFENALEFVGQFGGSSLAVAVKEQYAYLGQGPRLVTLDVSNPSSPTLLARSDLLPGIVQGIALDDEYVYVTTRYSGLHIFDISQPAAPKQISTVAPTPPGCGSLVLEDNIAYIACNPSGLFIVDVRDPINPVTLSEGVIKGSMLSIAIQDQYVYLVDATREGVIVVNVTDPRNPLQVGFFEAAEIPSPVAVTIEAIDRCNPYLCLAVANHGFVLLDLADPSNPYLLGDQTQFWSTGVISDGSYAYLLDDLEGLRVFDISSPANPQQVGLMPTSVGGFEFSVHETPRGMDIVDSVLYVPDQVYGLILIDISNPTKPIRVGQYVSPVPDWMMDIQVIDETAYAVCRYGGLRIVDVSDPINMVELAFDDERKDLYLQNPSGLEVVGDYAYISDTNYPFHVYDISDPNSPVQVSAVFDHAASDGAYDLAISGNYAYLSGWGLQDAFYPGSGIWVIDISDPRASKAVEFVEIPTGNLHSLSIQGQTLYALDLLGGGQPLRLHIFNISQPAQPILVNSIAVPGSQPLMLSDILVVGERLYLSMGYTTLLAYDISNPENPIEVLLPADQTIYAFMLTGEGSILFGSGNMAYDIQNPDAPRLVGIASEAIEAWTCDMEGDLVYIATKMHGIYVYRLDLTE